MFFGGAVGFLAGKYPFLSSKAGFKQKPEKFISRPDETRSGEGEEQEDKLLLDKMIKTCEALMKIAEIAILSTTSYEEGVNDDTSSDTNGASINDDVIIADSLSSDLDNKDEALPRIFSPTLPQNAWKKSDSLVPSPPLWTGLQPESRPIYPFPVEPGIPFVHFSTNRLSRKFSQLKSTPEVSLTYLDKEGAGYVTVKGEAEILGPGESAALWRDELILYYPEGPPSRSSPSSRFVVVRIHPRRLEFCSSRFGLESAHESWLPLALVWNKGRWSLDGENKIL